MVDNKIAWDTKCGVASNLSHFFFPLPPVEKCYSDRHCDWLHKSCCLNSTSVRKHTAAQLVRAEHLVRRFSVYTC